ncbi:MAG: hypothetical protein ACHP9Z_30095, partial [Streptosporangiales bacterium]
VLALAPPPRPPAPSRIRRARSWWWEVRGEALFRLRYVVLARLADRVATRCQRERAWVAGFEFGLGARERGPFWASLLGEYDDGNEAGISASRPNWMSGRRLLGEDRTRRPGLLARAAAHVLPVSRAGLAGEAARQDQRIGDLFCAMAIIGGRGARGPARRSPLVPVGPSAWKDGA